MKKDKKRFHCTYVWRLCAPSPLQNLYGINYLKYKPNSGAIVTEMFHDSKLTNEIFFLVDVKYPN